MHSDRREALARINHSATAEISHRHGMEGWNSTASRRTGTARGEVSSAPTAAVVTTTVCLRNQSRAREKCDPIEFSFHDLISYVLLFFEFIFSFGLTKAAGDIYDFAGDPSRIR